MLIINTCRVHKTSSLFHSGVGVQMLWW